MTITEEVTVEEPSPVDNVEIPDSDVPGSDLEGMSRYPESVRIEFIKERQGEVIWTEIEYLTDASMSEVREYYRDAFRQSEWNVNDIGFTQNSWIFFVVKGEREVFVELKPRGSGVEIDLEQTEPAPQKKTGADDRPDSGQAPQEPAPQQESQAAQQPAPAQPAPAQVAPAPVQPTPVYDDDYDDDFDDDYDDDFDDDYDYDD